MLLLFQLNLNGFPVAQIKMPKWFEVENHALNSIVKDLLLLLTYRAF